MTDDCATLESDSERLSYWVTQYGDSVRGYIFSMTRDVSLADDLTQETFCRVWQMRRQYTEQGVAKAYLFRVADRICLDYFRKNRREITLDAEAWQDTGVSDDAPSPSVYVESQEEIARLHFAMKDLSLAQQRVLSLHYFSQISFAEIAEILQIPLNTVLSHAYRGLSNLKKRFSSES